jgi:hypothetical protein
MRPRASTCPSRRSITPSRSITTPAPASSKTFAGEPGRVDRHVDPGDLEVDQLRHRHRHLDPVAVDRHDRRQRALRRHQLPELRARVEHQRVEGHLHLRTPEVPPRLVELRPRRVQAGHRAAPVGLSQREAARLLAELVDVGLPVVLRHLLAAALLDQRRAGLLERRRLGRHHRRVVAVVDADQRVAAVQQPAGQQRRAALDDPPAHLRLDHQAVHRLDLAERLQAIGWAAGWARSTVTGSSRLACGLAATSGFASIKARAANPAASRTRTGNR